jgi:hypothetical protein
MNLLVLDRFKISQSNIFFQIDTSGSFIFSNLLVSSMSSMNRV